MLKRIEDRLSRGLHGVAALVLLPLLVAVVAADVVARYVFNASLQWAQDVSTMAMLGLFIAALPIVTHREGHIRVEVVHDHFPPRVRDIANALGDLCGIAFMALLAYHELWEVPQMFERGEGSEVINIPYWPMAAFVALCSVLVSVILLHSAIRSIRSCLNPGRQ